MGFIHAENGGLIGAVRKTGVGAVSSTTQAGTYGGVTAAALGTIRNPYTSMSQLATADPGGGLYYFRIGIDVPEQLRADKIGGKYWLLAGSITEDDFGRGQNAGGTDFWYGQWTNTIETGSSYSATANDFKSRHWHSGTFDDLLVMQGFQSSPERGWANETDATEIAYSNGIFTSRGRNMRQMFASHITLGNHSSGGGVTIGCTFYKGSATQSRGRYRSNAFGELNPSNNFHFAAANVEGTTYSMSNALGCSFQGPNIEHHCWIGQNAQGDYSERNFPEPNWDSVWGINGVGHMYWLFYYA